MFGLCSGCVRVMLFNGFVYVFKKVMKLIMCMSKRDDDVDACGHECLMRPPTRDEDGVVCYVLGSMCAGFA